MITAYDCVTKFLEMFGSEAHFPQLYTGFNQKMDIQSLKCFLFRSLNWWVNYIKSLNSKKIFIYNRSGIKKNVIYTVFWMWTTVCVAAYYIGIFTKWFFSIYVLFLPWFRRNILRWEGHNHKFTLVLINTGLCARSTSSGTRRLNGRKVFSMSLVHVSHKRNSSYAVLGKPWTDFFFLFILQYISKRCRHEDWIYWRRRQGHQT